MFQHGREDSSFAVAKAQVKCERGELAQPENGRVLRSSSLWNVELEKPAQKRSNRWIPRCQLPWYFTGVSLPASVQLWGREKGSTRLLWSLAVARTDPSRADATPVSRPRPADAIRGA